MYAVGVFLRALAAFLLIGGHATVSYFFAGRLTVGMPTALRWTAVGICGMWLATAGFHLLAHLGLFTLPAALVVTCFAVVAIAASSRARSLTRADLARDARFVALLRRAFHASRWRLLILGFVALSATVMLRPFVIPPLGWDTLTYHGPKAALWVQQGRFAMLDGPGTWALFRNFVGGGEIFFAWAMLPFHGDLLALLVEPVQWAGVGLAVLAMGREMGVREPYGSAAAGFVLALPPLRLLVGSGYVEPGLCLALAAAFAFAVRYLRRAEPHAFLLAGASLGVACGIKVNSLPLAAIVVMAAALRAAVAPGSRRPRLGHLAAGMLALAVVFLPWLVINILDTGLPLSPLPMKIGGIALGKSVSVLEWYMDHPELRTGNWEREWAALEQLFQFGGPKVALLTAPSLIPLLVFMATLPLLIQQRPAVAGFAFAIVAATVASVFSRDMTVIRLLWTDTVGRFWLPAFLLAVPASTVWCKTWPAAGRIWFATLVLATYYQLDRLYLAGHSEANVQAEVVVALAVGAVWLLARGLRRLGMHVALRLSAGVLTAAALIALLAVGRDDTRHGSAVRSWAIHSIPTQWLPWARLLDDPSHPRRIAFVAPADQRSDNWFSYFFFGRRLQNHVEYVPVTADGALVDLRQVEALGVREPWLARVHTRNITDVMSLDPHSIEVRWMRQLPEQFTPTEANDTGALFHVNSWEPAVDPSTAAASRL
jgi:hypothetical protein